MDDETIVTARIIEPISVLAVKEVNPKEGWTSEMQCNSRQVFWIYLYLTYLDNEGTEFLLRQPLTERYMIRTLYNIAHHAQVEQMEARMIIPEQILLLLLEILTEEQIYRDFGGCPHDLESDPLVQVTDIIGIFLGLFTDELDDLGDLDLDPDVTSLDDLFQKGFQFPMANVDKLNQDPNVCNSATRALNRFIEFLVSQPNLSLGICRCFVSLSPLFGIRSICCETVNIRGAMRTLVCAISKSQNEKVEASASAGNLDSSGLQSAAICSLSGMLYYGKTDYCREFSDIEGAIQSVAHAMAPSNNEEAQMAAAYTLCIIGLRCGTDVSMKVYKTPEAISNLIKLLGKKDAPELQGAASHALKFFSMMGKKDFCSEFSSVTNAIEVLINAITTSNPVDVQDEAVCTLKNLASYGGQGLCEEICNVSGSISNLVVAMGNEYESDLQVSASQALYVLAENCGRDCCQKILEVTGVRDALCDAIAGVGREKEVGKFAASTLAALLDMRSW